MQIVEQGPCFVVLAPFDKNGRIVRYGDWVVTVISDKKKVAGLNLRTSDPRVWETEQIPEEVVKSAFAKKFEYKVKGKITAFKDPDTKECWYADNDCMGTLPCFSNSAIGGLCCQLVVKTSVQSIEGVCEPDPLFVLNFEDGMHFYAIPFPASYCVKQN